jgi:2-dehydropantoate 2-reductase
VWLLQEEDIISTIWRKLLISACVNPTNALTHGPTNSLVQSKRTADLLKAMAQEVMKVGVAVGASYQDTAEQWLAACAARFQTHKFSMLQDVEAGRELECAALVTAVSDIALDLGIETPRLDAVAALIEHYNDNIVKGRV